MVLINCACCAAPLPHPAKQCSRCKTLYCSPACQKQHWEQGGHDKLCRKIRKGGGAEQYRADTKYAAAVTVAAEACKEDAKGQTCYVCGQEAEEGLVRMCACRGTAGFAHVSCLAEQAKILMDEAEENNLCDRALEKRWERWHKCGQCEQNYHGIVACALGWACWKTYLGRSETDQVRVSAIRLLGNVLFDAGDHEDALLARQAELSLMKRVGAPGDHMLAVQTRVGYSYNALGRNEEALPLQRDVYSGRLKLHGENHQETIWSAGYLANSLYRTRRFDEGKALLRKVIPVARRVLGKGNIDVFRLRWSYGKFLYRAPDATLDDIREAVATLEETYSTVRRVFGAEHTYTREMDPHDLRCAQAELRAREGKWRGIGEVLGYVMDPEESPAAFKFNFKLL
jgi:tetratricopeptide (TPR) repeat protein